MVVYVVTARQRGRLTPVWALLLGLGLLALLAACGGGALEPATTVSTPPQAERTPVDDGLEDGGTQAAPDSGSSGDATPADDSALADESTQTADVPALSVGGDVGNQAPDFTVTLADGTTASQADLLADGKPLLLYFFATW